MVHGHLGFYPRICVPVGRRFWVPNDDVEGREEGDEEQINGVERFFEYLSFQF